MGKNEYIKALTRFKKALSKEKRIEKLIFFGSRATGNAGKDSDIDLIVVSPSFRGMNYWRSIGLRKHWDLPYPVDFLCYTPEEFSEKAKRITIVREAIKEGVEI